LCYGSCLSFREFSIRFGDCGLAMRDARAVGGGALYRWILRSRRMAFAECRQRRLRSRGSVVVAGSQSSVGAVSVKAANPVEAEQPRKQRRNTEFQAPQTSQGTTKSRKPYTCVPKRGHSKPRIPHKPLNPQGRLSDSQTENPGSIPGSATKTLSWHTPTQLKPIAATLTASPLSRTRHIP
jgi:hypothetical protein